MSCILALTCILHGRQELPHDTFLSVLDSALNLDMPKLRACCERHIVVDPNGHFTALEMAQHLPPESVMRIADARRKAFLSLRAQTLDFVQKKGCCCYNTYSNSGRTAYPHECASCQAFQVDLKCADLRKHVPSSMEFFKMAQPPARIS